MNYLLKSSISAKGVLSKMRNFYHLQRHVKQFSNNNLSSRIDIKPEVLNALNSNIPIVALESTIITHGMPYPHNLETAIAVEEIVREQNAIPATIAIIIGRIKVGLSKDELKLLSTWNSATVDKRTTTIKTSRRDLAFVLSKNWNGGTTVAGTLIIANLVGINVFATGGIGGVHRDGQNSMDISADLIELGKSSVAVVSSGVKSILDIPRTLEFLETQGVLVATYNCVDNDFPAFYTTKSGSKVPYNFNGPKEAAMAIADSLNLNLGSGILIAAPVPEQYAMDEKRINLAIADALQLANDQGVSGKEATPFLLDAIAKATDGRSLQTNIALIKNNAKIGGRIANELSKLKCGAENNNKIKKQTIITSKTNFTKKVPVVIGGSVVDTCISVSDADELKDIKY